MIKLMSTAKFPLNTVKGSYEQRINLAKSLNEKFYSNITREFNTKEVMPDIFERHLKNITGNKIILKIFDSTDEPFVGNTFLGVNPKNQGEADRFNIYLPLNRYDKSLSLNDTNIFMHEAFHFFFSIVNPKHTRRMIVKFEKDLCEKSDPFYNEYLYNKNVDLNALKHDILPDFLKRLSDNEKVDFLQSCRYRLTEELHAYKDGAKYYDRIQDDHLDVIHEKFTCDTGEAYKFQEKIEILKAFLKDTLNQIRAQIKI